jgi:hypothetical protein
MEIGSKRLLTTKRCCAWGCFLLLFASVVPLVSDQKKQVVVVSVSGEWKLVGQDSKPIAAPDNASNRPVRFGQTLLAGDLCLRGDEGSSIVLKYVTPSSETLYPFPCEKGNFGGPKTCTSPDKTCSIDLRDLSAGKGILASIKANIFDPMVQAISKQPERYMVAATRGADAELADAVVPMENSQIDLRAIFREMDPGIYYVELAPVDSPSSPRAPLRVVYAKGQAAPVAAATLRTGLYRVLQVTEKGEPGDSDCWVLVAASPDYPALAAAYSQAMSEAANLPSEMDPAATRALLRAYLESLSRTKKGATQP